MLALEIENCHMTYPDGFHALKGISFSVKSGDFFALLGPNGAGKSTTIGVLTSLLKHSSGKITVCGHNLETERNQVKSCIGVVPQEFNCSIFETASNIVASQAGFYGVPYHTAKARTEVIFKELDLWEKRNTIFRNLSGGMKRRLMIARALIHQPRLLILDEPTAGVDVELRLGMWDFLKALNRQGTTIILTTHYLEEAEKLCRHIAIINEGLILEHTTMRALLSKLQVEPYTLHLAAAISNCPQIENYDVIQLDDTTLEVAVPSQFGINSLVQQLSAQDIIIRAIRPKAGPLETLFLNLVQKRKMTEGEKS